MSNLYFVVHPLPGTEEQLAERLRELGERINRCGQGVPPVVAPSSTGSPAKCIKVGPGHIAILFEDGRVCRVACSVISDHVDLSRNEISKPSSKSFPGNSSRQQARQRGRFSRSTTFRGRGVIMGSSRPVVPAQFVPEDLIAQAQVVLQGKSRSLIVRELQRTNLDVNLAVNNLLSRDDEEGDDADDSQDSYVSEDLMSLLDSGMGGADSVMLSDAVDAVFPEDMFAYSTFRGRSANARLRQAERSVAEDPAFRDSFTRWRDRQYFGPRRWLENALREPWNNNIPDGGSGDARSASAKQGQGQPGTSGSAAGNITTPRNQSSPLWLSDEIEYWPDSTKRFTAIAAMHSELIAISTTGTIYQWKWTDFEPYKHHDNPNINHPRVTQLGLVNEKVTCISSSPIRCTVATESGKISTWVDESISHVASRLEHTAQPFTEALLGQKIIQLATSNLYTLARTETNSFYWWGVLPFTQRKKLWDKYRTKSKKSQKCSGKGDDKDIVVGSQVIIRVSPLYQSGAIGFTTAGGIPKVGQLLNSAWSLSDVARFKVLPGPRRTEIRRPENRSADSMPPPPSPASSTCSDTTIPSNTPKRPKKHPTTSEKEEKNEEEWALKDVIFIEDSKTVPIGSVLKVDGAYALVHFKTTPQGGKEEDVTSLIDDSRLLRINELQIIKNGSLPKAPDCIQKLPKRVCLPDFTNILSLAADIGGIQALVRDGKKVFFKTFSLHSGRMEKESRFPIDISAFLGLDQSVISLYSCGIGDTEQMTILRDGNGTLFPLVKDALDTVKDPILLDLPPVKCLGLGIHALPHVGPSQKNQVGVLVLALEPQVLMDKILKCEVEGIRSVISTLDTDFLNRSGGLTLSRILLERADGNRNIFHVCVSVGIPTLNKEVEPQTNNAPSSSANAPTPAGTTFGTNSEDSTASKTPSSLRDLMRRGNVEVDETYPSVQVSSLPVLDAEDSNESLDSAQALNMGLKALGLSAGSLQSSAGSTIPTSVWDPVERIKNAHQGLKLLLGSVALEPHLHQFLGERDSRGQTPFMLAVSSRAYPAALTLFEAIQKISKEKSPDVDVQKKVLMSMVYPPGAPPDDSPLHLLCANDTCSFTWTGAEHINQDIFECRTCGLVGSLCCCTECARVCHKGHDCKLKRTSPTAYCDCWEKCRCKSLIMGNQSSRFDLLVKLVQETDLVSVNNSRGENILLFLAGTTGRQMVEQRQYRATRRTPVQRKATDVSGQDLEMPDHDLQPPKFCRMALEQLLDDWSAVKAMVMLGVGSSIDEQSGTALLDKFTYKILVKCGSEMIDTLLITLVRELESSTESRRVEANTVARRFLRSVSRIFVVASVELAPVAKKAPTTPRSVPSHIESCRRVFQALALISIEELSEMASSQITPVRLGVVRPTAPFSLLSGSAETLTGSEELFNMDPLQPYNRNTSRADSESRGSRHISTGHLEGSALQLVSGEDGEADGEDGAEEHEGDGEGDRQGGESSEHEMDQNEAQGGAPQPAEQMEGIEQESDMELDLLAESESDSDDNANDQPPQRSQLESGGDGSGGGNMSLFSEDDSDDSTQQEDEEDEEEESDGNETDEREVPLPSNPPQPAANPTSSTSNPPPTTAATNQQSLTISSTIPADDFSATSAEEALFERRNAPITPAAPQANQRTGSTQPVSMQWAVRSRDPTAMRTGGLVFIDHASGTMRRSAASTAAAAIAAAASSAQESITMATTASGLARSFGIIIREISSMLNYLKEYSTNLPILPRRLEVTQETFNQVQIALDKKLLPVWEWLLRVMDSTESQLRFGGTLSTDNSQSHVRNHGRALPTTHLAWTNRSSAPTQPSDPRPGAREDVHSARREFLSYSLSLMRSHNSEHLDSLPVIDVSSLKHIAYVFDALIHFMRAGVESTSECPNELENIIIHDPEEVDDVGYSVAGNSTSSVVDDFEDDVFSAKGKRHVFFQRSDSTLCLGCAAPDPFQGPLVESLPLAEKPHLLQPTVRREDLFGLPMNSGSKSGLGDIEMNQLGLSSRLDSKGNYSALLERKVLPTTNEESKEVDSEGGNVEMESLEGLPIACSSSQSPMKPTQLLKIASPIKNWDVPQDLSMGRMEETEHQGSRAPIIVSPRKTTEARSPAKSVIVCHRPHVATSDEAPELLLVPVDAAIEEVSSNVTIETTPSQPRLQARLAGKKADDLLLNPTIVTDDILLGRWRVTLELFGRVFVDDVGLESGSVISELGGFPVKETRFRREMEKLRNAQQRDLNLSKVERDRSLLILNTFKELNNHVTSSNRRGASTYPPLAVNRVKVTFKDEPGEGSGVARSFYTSLAEAVLVEDKIPNLDGLVGAKYGNQFNVLQRMKLREDYIRRGGQVRIIKVNRNSPRFREIRRNLSLDARPFHPAGTGSTSSGEGSGTANPGPITINDHLSSHQQNIGERLYVKVNQLRSNLATRITGMLLELPPNQIMPLLTSDDALKVRIDEAVDLILANPRDGPASDAIIDIDVFNFSKSSSNTPGSSSSVVSVPPKKSPELSEKDADWSADADDSPLFYQPGKKGFYSPRQGKPTAERLNAFRNVGRIMGLCLLQNELCPIYLNRHVLKYILGRPIRFHDMAFFDPVIYESFRQLVLDSEDVGAHELLASMELTFSVDLSMEEGGKNIELLPGGRSTEVTKTNVFDYVRKYAGYRMVRSQVKALEELRGGVFDVIPNSALDGFTSEDLRLLLNGVGQINISTLMAYTSFNDESAESSEKLGRFKKWFWSILEKMSNLERQELLYFWTGSPALPASEDGFQPMPTVTIRPADDSHLPTANTCISRLYVPLYSSRHILRHKVLLAIKTRNFGFV